MQPGSFGGPKSFVVRISRSFDEGDINYAIVDLSDDALRLISDRNRSFHMVKAVDEDLIELVFYADECTFCLGDLRRILSPKQWETYEEFNIVAIEPGQELPPHDHITELDRVSVRENGVVWTARVKHSEVMVETKELTLREIFGKDSG